MNEWKERDRYAFVLVATCAYIASLFLAWWQVGMTGNSPVIRMDALGGSFGATNRLGQLCAVIAVAILILTVSTLRSHDRRLPLALRQLAVALVIFNALSVLELWRTTADMAPNFYRDTHIDYGAYVAIGASLVVLLSVLVLGAGGLRGLFERRKHPKRVSVNT